MLRYKPIQICLVSFGSRNVQKHRVYSDGIFFRFHLCSKAHDTFYPEKLFFTFDRTVNSTDACMHARCTYVVILHALPFLQSPTGKAVLWWQSSFPSMERYPILPTASSACR